MTVQLRVGYDDMASSTARPFSRLMTLRRMGGYGGALAVTPYLLIKVAWTLGLFLPTEHMGDASWRAINATTALLAVTGILLALAFTQPWGERLPAWLAVLPVWIGTGLLVPILLLAPVLGPAAMIRDKAAGSAGVWGYEQLLVMLSLVGIGIGLPLALAGYVKARWPEAMGGPLDYPEQVGNTRQLQVTLARLATAGCVLLGVAKIYWAAGGIFGLDPARLGLRDLWWHLLSLSTGAWALAGAWGLLVLTSRRGARRFLLPMAAAWVSSGMLFSHNVFNGLSSVRPDAQPTPEYSLPQLLTTEGGIVLGTMMGMIILLVLHDRRRALRGEP